MRRTLALLAFSTLTACSALGGEFDQQIDGTWTGNANGQSISMQLIQTGNVTGIATISSAGVSRSFGVSGKFVSPTFTAELSGTAPGDTIALATTVSGRSMSGTLSGSGFTGNAVTLQRQ
jgi:hypothetical protein